MEEMNNGMQNVPQGKRKLGFWLGFAAGLFVMLLLGAAISCFVVFSLLRDYGTLDYNAAGTQGEITVENMNAAPNPADLDYDRIDSKIPA